MNKVGGVGADPQPKLDRHRFVRKALHVNTFVQAIADEALPAHAERVRPQTGASGLTPGSSIGGSSRSTARTPAASDNMKELPASTATASGPSSGGRSRTVALDPPA